MKNVDSQMTLSGYHFHTSDWCKWLLVSGKKKLQICLAELKIVILYFHLTFICSIKRFELIIIYLNCRRVKNSSSKVSTWQKARPNSNRVTLPYKCSRRQGPLQLSTILITEMQERRVKVVRQIFCLAISRKPPSQSDHSTPSSSTRSTLMWTLPR